MDQNAIQTVIGLAKTGELAHLPTDKYHPSLIQKGEVVSAEPFAKVPYGIRADRELPSLKAFIDYITTFRKPETVVFADSTTQKIEAVLDYHAPAPLTTAPSHETPSWCHHKASFKLVQDEDFKHFMSLDGREINQDDLVIELTDYANNFVLPIPADVLNIIGDIDLVNNKEVSSKVSAGSLNTLFKHDVTLKSRGKDIPTIFTVALPVFKGFPQQYQVPFRLLFKFREGSNKITFVLKLIRPHAIIEAAFQDVCNTVLESVPHVPVFGAVGTVFVNATVYGPAPQPQQPPAPTVEAVTEETPIE